MKNLKNAFIYPNSTINEAIRVLDSGVYGIAVIINENSELIGTITDGDIRRALLKNINFSLPVSSIMNTNPTFFEKGVSNKKLIETMNHKKIRHIPITKNKKVIDIALLWDLTEEKYNVDTAVILTGGIGKRLQPKTFEIPKPLLKIKNKPIIEIILDKLSSYGISNVILCTGYKSEMFFEHFKSGNYNGISIKCVKESKKLGTAAPLKLAEKYISKSFYVMNGDILTNINFESMNYFHYSNDSKLTVAVKQYDIEVPYGVINVKNEKIIAINEKPTYNFHVNAGVYLMDKIILNYIPENEYFDMPELIKKIIKQDKKVCSFPINEYWVDIGTKIDFERARNESELWK